MMPLRAKKCRDCKKTFTPFNSITPRCFDCAATWALTKVRKDYKSEQKALKKKERKNQADRKMAVKTRSEWLKEAQAAFNAYIRERDKQSACISCQRHHTGQYHAGHYLSVGAHIELRFCEINCHKQCAPCNNHLSGNPINYRINLVKKIGLDKVEWLEGAHELQKLTIEQIKEVKAMYKRKLKELK